MRALRGNIFEVRSDLIRWIANQPVAVRKQAKQVIINLAIALGDPDPAQASMNSVLADQVAQLRTLVAETRWYRRR
jgi:hypothetical protein